MLTGAVPESRQSVKLLIDPSLAVIAFRQSRQGYLLSSCSRHHRSLTSTRLFR